MRITWNSVMGITWSFLNNSHYITHGNGSNIDDIRRNYF